MNRLFGNILKIKDLTVNQKDEMFFLMDTFYENMKKDISITLFNGEGKIKGFSTLKHINFDLDAKKINGIFSGYTIIDKE